VDSLYRDPKRLIFVAASNSMSGQAAFDQGIVACGEQMNRIDPVAASKLLKT